MPVPRYVQNFNGRHAIVYSVDPRIPEVLLPTLGKLGVSVCHQLSAEAENDFANLEISADRTIVIVDGDLPRMPELPMQMAAEPLPIVPTVGLVGVEAPSRLRALMQVGATSFLRKPVHAGSVFSALYLAVNEHARRSEMSVRIEALEERRRQRRYVIKAITHLMTETNVDDEVAFAILRKESMRSRMSIEAYCHQVVQRRAASSQFGFEAVSPLRKVE